MRIQLVFSGNLFLPVCQLSPTEYFWLDTSTLETTTTNNIAKAKRKTHQEQFMGV